MLKEIESNLYFLLSDYVAWCLILICFLTALLAYYYQTVFNTQYNCRTESEFSRLTAVAYTIIGIGLAIVKVMYG